MTDIKALPSNLKEMEKKPRFVQFYKSHNIEALQDMLVDIEANYRSDDNKAALVWRYMDAKGMDFDDASNDRVDEQNDSTVEDELTDENIDKVEAGTDENAQTVQDDTNDEHGAPGDQSNVEVGTETDRAVADSGEKPDEVVDVADHDAPSNTGDSNDDNADKANKPAETAGQSTADNSTSTDKTSPTQAVSEEVDAEPEHVSIKNTGDFGIYEPASCTLLKAGETTKAYVTPHASREKIIANIHQLNSTRGKKLHVTN